MLQRIEIIFAACLLYPAMNRESEDGIDDILWFF